MSKKMIVCLLAGMILLISGFAFAQPSQSKQPESKGITYGIDGRFRQDAYSNADETNVINDETRFFRVRTRLFLNIDMGDNLEGYVRMANETWKRQDATNSLGKSVSAPISAGDIWFDNAYLNFKKLPGIPSLSLKVGRQDIGKGDGFFMQTGRGGYGPKAVSFDAFNLGYTRGKQKVELIGIWNPQNDDFYPQINGNYASIPGISVSGPTYLNDMGTVQSLGAYYTGRQLKNTDIDGYYFFVKEYEMSNIAIKGQAPSFAGTYNNYHYQPDQHFNAIGGRIVERLPHDLVIHANFTAQLGTQDAMTTANSKLFANVNNPNGPQTVGCAAGIAACGYQGVNIRAFGFYPYVTKYFPKVKTEPYIRVVSMLLSGQDPKNLKTNGNFNPVFSQWAFQPSPYRENGYNTPQFSDDFTQNQTTEVGPTPAYRTNEKDFGVEVGFTPFQNAKKDKKLQFLVAFQHVGAFHPFVGNPVHYYMAPGQSFPTLIPGTGGGIIQTGVAGACTTLTVCVPNVGQFSQTGLSRFNMIKPRADIVLSSHFSGFLTFEELYYGDFFNKTWNTQVVGVAKVAQRANSPFFRAEFQWKFDSFLPYHKTTK